MQTFVKTTLFTLVGLGIPAAIAAGAPPASIPENAETVVVESGTATFLSATNVPAVSVKGKSSALQARVQIRHEGDGITLERIEAWVPVKTLATGMGVRDEHMRRYIFTTSNGEIPDLRFESEKAACPGVAPGHEATCEVSGTLAIRGVARKFSMSLKVKQAGTAAFRAAGEGTVKLSDYGIEQPSQFGVKSANEVTVHLEFTGKPGAKQSAALTTAAPGGRP